MVQMLSSSPNRNQLRIIHIFAIEGHDIVKHTLGFHSGTVGIKLYSFDIAVDGFMPFGFFTKGIAFFVPLLGGSKLYTLHSTLLTCSIPSCLQPAYSSSANRWS